MRPTISSWSIWGYLPVIAAIAVVWSHSIANAQSRAGTPLKLDTGEEIYKAACVGCHGPDGKGQPKSTLGFEPPSTFPDFTDCAGATPEPDTHWATMIHEGGRSKGFSPIMPAFGDALTSEQIKLVVGYLRTLCTDQHWPQGDMNFPRPLFTEKAFPENETVLTTAFNTTGPAGITNELVVEKRLGARTNMELIVPGAFQKQPSSSWFGGIGDISLELKRTVFFSNRTGSILALAGELKLPTGDANRGFGNGVTTLESFASFGQALPRQSFVQTQFGIEGPYRRSQIPAEMFWRTAVGKTLAQDRGFGRGWTPMVETVGVRELRPQAKIEWDVVPQMQVTLNKRQHIRANVGISVPFANTANRATQVVFYLLWDWFDGGLRDGWK